MSCIFVQNKLIKAFSITEIMIAIGVIGIITGIASYTYANYSAKSQVTEAMSILDSYVHAAQTYYIENSNMPTSINNIGGAYSRSSSKDTVNSVTFSYGTNSISIGAVFSTYAAKPLQNNSLNLQLTISTGGTSSTGMFSIICNASNISNAYLPASCQQ